MTKKALDANELLCDNNTVKTHQVNRSDLKKKRLGFVDKNLGYKKNSLYFSTKFVRMSKQIKKGEHRQLLLKLQMRLSSCETTKATIWNHMFF